MHRSGRTLAGGLALGGLLVLLLILTGPAGRAPASFPGSNGRLAIMSDRGTEGYQLFTINPGGGSIHRLTHSDTYVSLPTFSKSGEKIAFVKGAPPDGKGEIYAMRRDGTHQRNLTQNPASDSSPYFSPDGEQIVFDSDRAGRRQLFLMNSDGSHLRRIIHGSHEDADPVFFPNGGKIAFDRTVGGQGEIYTSHLDGSHQRRLTDNSKYDYYPDVSPDGTLIAFGRDASESNSELFVMRSDGTDEKRLTHTSEAREFDPTFSPDNRKIAFDSAASEMDDFDIFVMKANGTRRHTILDGPSGDYVSDWARR